MGPIGLKNLQRRFNILPNIKKLANNCQIGTLKMLPLWQNFAKSGHTACHLQSIVPSHLSLVLRHLVCLLKIDYCVAIDFSPTQNVERCVAQVCS